MKRLRKADVPVELDELGREEEHCCSSLGQRKRRLSVEQVEALEKDFEVESKLDLERKLRLAQELSLRPQQIAVWFQNRRARLKAKRLERDYGTLKARHDALKLDVDALRSHREALVSQLRELKAKLGKPAVATEPKPSVVELLGANAAAQCASFLIGFHRARLDEESNLEEVFFSESELRGCLFSDKQAWE